MTTRKIDTKAVGAVFSTYIGKAGELFYDTASNTLKISNGTTPGGATLSTDGSGGGTVISSSFGVTSTSAGATTSDGKLYFGILPFISSTPRLPIRLRRSTPPSWRRRARQSVHPGSVAPGVSL